VALFIRDFEKGFLSSRGLLRIMIFVLLEVRLKEEAGKMPCEVKKYNCQTRDGDVIAF